MVGRLYESVKEVEDWKPLKSSEMSIIIHGEDIVRFIRSRKNGWLDHEEGMPQEWQRKQLIRPII